MPDENKFKVLDNIGYKIEGCCGLCEHGVFQSNPSPYFGTCKIWEYEHLKHVGPPRKISVHKFGSCNSFSPNAHKTSHLQSFFKFFKGAGK